VTSREKLAKVVATLGERDTDKKLDKEKEQKRIEVDSLRFSPQVNFAIGNHLVTEVLHPFRWELNNVTGHGSVANRIRKKHSDLFDCFAPVLISTIVRVPYVRRSVVEFNKNTLELQQKTEDYYLYDFMADFRRCVAQTLALSYGADLLFLGRSPECMYDYLCGVYREDEALASKLKLMHFSMRNLWKSEWREEIIQPSSEVRKKL